MKTFLFEVTVYDGEHEHRDHVLIKAKNQTAAWKLGEKELHNVGQENSGTFWNYGDGLTASRARGIPEVSKKEAQVLSRLRVVHFLN